MKVNVVLVSDKKILTPVWILLRYSGCDENEQPSGTTRTRRPAVFIFFAHKNFFDFYAFADKLISIDGAATADIFIISFCLEVPGKSGNTLNQYYLFLMK